MRDELSDERRAELIELLPPWAMFIVAMAGVAGWILAAMMAA